MSLLWLALGIGVAVFVVRTIRADKRAQRANAEALAEPAPKKKKKKNRKPTPVAEEAAPPAHAEALVIPATWGWAKLHLASADMKALGYYYRDKSAGYSFKILVELKDSPSDDEIRERARAQDYFANTTFRLSGHETIYAVAREGEMAATYEATFEAGKGTAGPEYAIVMLLTAAEKRVYELPAAMPHIEVYL